MKILLELPSSLRPPIPKYKISCPPLSPLQSVGSGELWEASESLREPKGATGSCSSFPPRVLYPCCFTKTTILHQRHLKNSFLAISSRSHQTSPIFKNYIIHSDFVLINWLHADLLAPPWSGEEKREIWGNLYFGQRVNMKTDL